MPIIFSRNLRSANDFDYNYLFLCSEVCCLSVCLSVVCHTWHSV